MEKTVAPRIQLGHIAVCGAGLAGYMTAAALLQHLPESIQVTLLLIDEHPAADLFYGSVATPSSYQFNLSMGVSEPRLVLDSTTGFSFGTQYRDWGGARRSWVQGFQLPLPILNGVLFHQYLIRLEMNDLEPFLISAEAARRGGFAHPPEAAGHPLGRAEYGYQLDPASYKALFAAALRDSRVRVIKANIADVECHADEIICLRPTDGEPIKADLYIDATGPDAVLLSRLGARRPDGRRLGAVLSHEPSDVLGPAVRTITGHGFGWQSQTPLQGGVARLTVFAENDETPALTAHGDAPVLSATATFGAQDEAWIGNCAAVGQAAATIEPLTPAPIMLLQADIERLISLIPVSSDMAMERREYNRQFTANYSHAEMFRRAMFATAPIEGSAYWQANLALPADACLERKIAQFLSRGLLVSYDLEPFTAEDWTILHYGMGRRPRRHDRLADQSSKSEVEAYLAGLRRDIATVASSLPLHGDYMTNLKRYLVQKGI
ncbi:MAG: tryptophan 7-halogenase [Asticcacaulis sp.]|nr:tryptophan 7-halogenase [Asticcacaulis sp.]